MTAFAVWAVRIIALLIILRIVMFLISKKPPSFGGPKPSRRFDTKGESVEDGDFREL